LNGATATAQNSGQFNVVGGTATLNYYAQYIAMGTATSGGVASSVQYTITYP
jgi:major type 1 subunit fimbrin (pilin)